MKKIRPVLEPEARALIIKSWGWRIKRLGHTQTSFARKIGKDQADMSNWISLKIIPIDKSFWKVEDRIRKMESDSGFASNNAEGVVVS